MNCKHEQESSAVKPTRRVNTQTRKQRPTRLSSHLRAENVKIGVFEAEHFQEGR